MKPLHSLQFIAISLLLAACGSDDGAPSPSIPDDGEALDDGSGSPAANPQPSPQLLDEDEPTNPTAPEFAGCERGTLEPDFAPQPFAGPNVVNGAVPAGDYVISSTYLQLAADAPSQALFQQLVGPVVEDLETRAGLVAVSLGQSPSCGVARTLAVWEDDVAMIAFVTSPAHAAAMARVTDISRGGSIVTHWTGNEAAANWATAAERVGADDGPEY